MNFKEKFKQRQGITLIALVVTIIVLLILAGITIAMLTGQNGILNRATEARDANGIAQIDEQVKLAVAEALSNGLGTITDTNLKVALNNNVGAGNYEISGDETKGWTIKAGEKTYQINGNGDISGGDNTGGNSGGTTGDEDSLYIDDSYVDYDVAYTDIYTNKDYTNLTGWRILKQESKGNGIYDLEIISTGIPAGLNYQASYIKDSTYTPWAGTLEQISTYKEKYYSSPSKDNIGSNMYGASGLRYNFEKIKFKKAKRN